MNTILEHLSKRMREIVGFDPSSDKDSQFVTLDQLGRFMKAEACLGPYRFSGSKLVDALLIHLFREDARRIIEEPIKHLRCPRCREQTAYAPDKNGARSFSVKD
jgi:hypothetical protein